MTAIHEHTEMRQVATRLPAETGTPVKLPSYDQVRREIHRLGSESDLVVVRERAKSLPRMRESPQSFALSIPSPALLTQVDEHSLELYVVTPGGIAVTQRFERRLPNTSYGVHDASTAAQAGGMTLEELERCFYQAIVDDYQQAWNELRRQRRTVLWEQAVAQSGVPQYLGSPDDLKLLLMKAVNRKTPHHGYRVSDGNRLSFQGRWYVCPGLLSRLQGREFEVYYDRRDVGVL